MLIVPALVEPSLSQVRDLIREYGSLPGVVRCFQDFESELATLPGAYAPPGGRLLMAVADADESPHQAVGCVGLRKWKEHVCEMKRLYVRPALRGKNVGRALVEAIVREARGMGYETMVLDTLPSMSEAHRLYRTLGFREIPAYQDHPIPDALFFELPLC